MTSRAPRSPLLAAGFPTAGPWAPGGHTTPAGSAGGAGQSGQNFQSSLRRGWRTLSRQRAPCPCSWPKRTAGTGCTQSGTMLQITVTRSLLRPSGRPLALATCLRCRHQAFSTTYQRLADTKATKATKGRSAGKHAAAAAPAPQEADESAPTPPPVENPLANAPRSYGKRVENFKPTVLPRPIGMQKPPQPGENTGIDLRSIKKRRNDFVNWEKHLKRREEL